MSEENKPTRRPLKLYELMWYTSEQLYKIAQKLRIPKYYSMTKRQLADSLVGRVYREEKEEDDR